MIPYSAYMKRAAAPTRPSPSYTSATETGLTSTGTPKPFQAPRYYDRPGVNPELAAQGKQLEADYARQFPYGDYTYSTKGWGYRGGQRAQMDQEQIDLRNRFRLYEAQARGISPSNPQAVAPSPSAASAFVGDLARSPIMPTAPFMYAYDVGTKGLQQATADKMQSDAVYGSMLADAGKRVANRWGGNFELQYNDPYLNYASYALEAAPSLLLAAGTGGGSLAAQGAARTGATVAPSAFRTLGRFAATGFQPALQGSTNPVVRFAGRSIPAFTNYAMSGLNPVPLIMGTMRTAGVDRVLSQLGAHLATHGAANNYANAYRDTAAFNAANPNVAGTPESLQRFGESLLAGGIHLDPTALNPWGIGASSFLPSIDEQRESAIDRATELKISQMSPEKQALVLSDPAQYAVVRKQIIDEFYPNSFVRHATDVVTLNPLRALGATSYSENLATNKDTATNVATSAMGFKNTALLDPKFFKDLNDLSFDFAQNPESINSSGLGKHLMQSPLAAQVGGNPRNVIAAAQMMAGLNRTLANMYYAYQQTGQVPPGYTELAQQADNIAKAQQLPVEVQESGNTPLVDALLQLRPVMNQIYPGAQQTQGATQ